MVFCEYTCGRVTGNKRVLFLFCCRPARVLPRDKLERSEERRSAGGDQHGYERQKKLKLNNYKKGKKKKSRSVRVAGAAFVCCGPPRSEVGKHVGVRVSGDAFGAEK